MENNTRIFEELVARNRKSEPCALVIVTETEGSVPVPPGAKMIVTADGECIGTIGGGSMEFDIISSALRVIGEGTARTILMDLTNEGGHVCGGKAAVYIEAVIPSPRLVIAGAGHVGQALCRLAADTGFSVTVVDDRSEYADPDRLPGADQVIATMFENMFNEVKTDERTYIVCATRGHSHDYRVVRDALYTPASYIGLLGSRHKRRTFMEKLRADNVTESDLVRLHTPVGIEIGAVTPQEIAVSIVAELIHKRRKDVFEYRSDTAGSRDIPANG